MLAAVALLEEHHEARRRDVRWSGGRSIADSNSRRTPWVPTRVPV